MGTTLTYNGVSILQCKTQAFSQENQYDETGTDLLYQKVLIHVRGYCHASTTPNSVGTSVGGVNAQATYDLVRKLLMEPRKTLQFIVDGVTVITGTPIGAGAEVFAGTDVNNGPKPQRCDVSEFTTALFRVDYMLECYIVDCATLNNTTGILSNRWHFEDDFDETQFISRNLRGTLRVASLPINPHSLRHLCMPPLQDGFARKSIRCACSPDGMTLTYSVRDKQVKAAPPYPAKRWEATHSLGTSDGVMTIASISITLEGSPDTDKRDLIATAATIATTKLEIAGKANGEGYLLSGCQIVDRLHTCIIEMHISVKVLLTKDFKSLGQKISGIVDSMGQTLDKMTPPLAGYDPLKNPVTKAYPNDSLVGLFVCYLQSPCNDYHSLPQLAQDGGAVGSSQQTKPTAQVETYQGTLQTDPSPGNNLSDATKANLYTFYQIDSKTIVMQGKVQLPIGTIGTSPPDQPTSKTFSIFPPQARRTVVIAAERAGDWPGLPTLEDVTEGGITYTVLNYEAEPKAPSTTADGVTKLFSVDCSIVYSMSRPPKNGEGFRSGALPWNKDQVAANSYPYASLSNGIV